MAAHPQNRSDRQVGMKEIRTGDLFANPHNPRVLFDKQPMKVLEESIRRVGILVPLTVYWEKAKSRYVILDGQRRWICAKAIKKAKVPINEVPEPGLVQNIVTMFQIHKLREDWELMPTALKIELLIKKVKDQNNERLAELTGLDVAVIVRCKKLIYYDRKFQDMMLDANPDLRIKADFFIELYAVLRDRDVISFKWFSEEAFIQQMLRKYLKEPRTIKSVTDFRLIKQHLTRARKANAIEKISLRLKEFAEDPSIPLSHLAIAEVSVRNDADSIVKKVSALDAVIREMETENFYGEQSLWEAFEKLLALLESRLKEADKRRLL